MTKLFVAIFVILVVLVSAGWFVHNSKLAKPEDSNVSVSPAKLKDFSTDFSTRTIDLGQILPGGPSKDGIPALTDPAMIAPGRVTYGDDELGVLVQIKDDSQWFPFSVLVWHEIVNTTVGDQPVAVTFCPLCGTSIVFSRQVDGQVLEFGVSGFLYESNLLMYDRSTESFWSQALGEAVVGEYSGTRLEILPMQRIAWGVVKERYPDTLAMSSETGHDRAYGVNPYDGYENSEQLIFPVSVNDSRFPPKELMYVIPYQGEHWFTFPVASQEPGQTNTYEYNGSTFVVSNTGGSITVKESDEVLPGYYEMWFSFATHHQDNGVVWK